MCPRGRYRPKKKYQLIVDSQINRLRKNNNYIYKILIRFPIKTIIMVKQYKLHKILTFSSDQSRNFSRNEHV